MKIHESQGESGEIDISPNAENQLSFLFSYLNNFVYDQIKLASNCPDLVLHESWRQLKTIRICYNVQRERNSEEFVYEKSITLNTHFNTID